MSIRIQFDLSEDEYETMKPYIMNHKLRHSIAHQALLEWRNRKEGRDIKRRKEQLISDKKILLPIINDLIKDGVFNLQ